MTYTSEEVQDRILFLAECGIDTAALAMLTAYADLLAQIERAEPYRYTWAKEPDADGVFRKIPLYTHPSADRIVTTNPAPHAAAPSMPSKTVQMEVGCATAQEQIAWHQREIARLTAQITGDPREGVTVAAQK